VESNISLTVYWVDNKPYVSASELFQNILPTSQNYYPTWVRINITHQPQELPEKGTDYLLATDTKVTIKNIRVRGGKKRIEYLLSIPFARELCYQTKTYPARNVRRFLYKIGN